MSVNEGEDRNFVRALARGLAVIESFNDEQAGMTLSDVARRTKLSRGTAARILHTLEELGYVRSDGRTMTLLPKTLRLGYAYLSSQPIWQLAFPILEKLTAELEVPASLSVLDGHDIVFMMTSANYRNLSVMQYANSVGLRLPAFCAAAGRVLLASRSDAELDAYFSSVDLKKRTPNTVTDPNRLREIIRKARTDGYAIQDEELELGIRAIAVPVFTKSLTVLGSLNVTSRVGRHSIKDLVRNVLPILQREAEELKVLLRGISA